jgi:hypothetical protein
LRETLGAAAQRKIAAGYLWERRGERMQAEYNDLSFRWPWVAQPGCGGEIHWFYYAKSLGNELRKLLCLWNYAMNFRGFGACCKSGQWGLLLFTLSRYPTLAVIKLMHSQAGKRPYSRQSCGADSFMLPLPF